MLTSGMATIRPLRGKHQAMIRLKGFPHVSETFERKTDAKLWAQKTEAAMRAGKWFPERAGAEKTVADAIDRFLAEAMPSRADRDTEEPRLKWWRSELGAFALGNLTPAAITAARDKLLATPMPSRAKKREPGEKPKGGRPKPKGVVAPRAKSTVNRYLAILSTVFTHAVKDWGWLPDNPLRRVRKLKEPPGRVRWLEADELGRLLDSCTEGPEWLPFFVECSLGTAVRWSEMAKRQLPDLQLERRRLLLSTVTKNGERRGVRLSDPVVKAFTAWLAVRPNVESDLIFPETKGFQKRWTEAKTRAQIEDFHFHDLRHTAASYLAMKGATLAEIAEVLGHKTLAMVKRYAHLAESHVDRVVDRVGDVIAEVPRAEPKPRKPSAAASSRAKGRAPESTA